MPRKKIEVPCNVEYLSIVDMEGKVDKDLEPNLEKDFLLKLHRAMLLGRRFDEQMLRLQRQGRIGTFPPISGQEAAQIGAVAALKDTDWVVYAFREAAAQLWRGKRMENILAYFGGYKQAAEVPEDSTDLPDSIPVGTQIVLASGIGYGIQYRKKDDVVLVFFGEGATSEGDFHEGVNFAGVFQTPTIFLCQNNQWAISLKPSQQTHSETFAQKAMAYCIPGIQVDGNDVLAVYTAVSEAVERARDGGGPTLVECVTYRLSLHTTSDDPKRYRTEEELQEWEKRDPIPRFQKYLKQKDLLSDKQLAALEDELNDEIKDAIQKAEDKMTELEKDSLSIFEHMYAEMPPYLEEQRKELERELSEMEEKNG
jgi:pyruvate dehydrogenase E1 component alpha subunit